MDEDSIVMSNLGQDKMLGGSAGEEQGDDVLQNSGNGVGLTRAPTSDKASQTSVSSELPPQTPALETKCRKNTLTFLNLPVEIRLMIYEELLLVGKVFYGPIDSEHEQEEGRRYWSYYKFLPPQVSLLGVCKQIHAEAEKAYLSNNLFVLPLLWYKDAPFVAPNTYSEDDTRYLFSQRGLSLV